MKKPLLCLVILFLSFFSFSQTKLSKDNQIDCGVPSMDLNESKELVEYMNAIKSIETIGPKKRVHYVIPVVFHVIYHPSFLETNVTDEGIIDYLEELNKNFTIINSGSGDLEDFATEFSSVIGTTNLEFRMATFDNDGYPISGLPVTRHPQVFIEDSYAAKEELIYKYGWDSKKYLNVYVMHSGGGNHGVFPLKMSPISGFSVAQHPFLDGVFLRSNLFGPEFLNPSYESPVPDEERLPVFAHEVGHWAGLFHIFHNGCTYPGDYVDDTPYQMVEGVNIGDNTCNEGLGDLPDMVQNFMSYSDDHRVMFTSDQVDRMYYWLGQDPKRSEVVVSDRADPIDPSAIYANFEMNGADYVPSGGLNDQMPNDFGTWDLYETNENEFVEFNGTYYSQCLGGEPNYSWSVVSDDGLVSSLFNGSDLSLSFIHPATYEITLTVSNLCDTDEVVKHVYVSPSILIEAQNDNKMKISPNAATANQTIKVPEVQDPKAFKIISFTGSTVQSGTVDDSKSIAIGSIKAGVYVLHIIEDDGSLHTEQLIIKN